MRDFLLTTPYYVGIPLILWIICMGLFFFGFILFLIEAKKSELKSQKMINKAYGIFLLCMGLTRIFFILGVYFYLPTLCDDCYDFYTTLGYISAIAGVAFWLYVAETHLIHKTKKLFTILSIILLALSLIVLFGIIFPDLAIIDRDLSLELQTYLMPVAVGILGILYIYLVIKTTGTVRKKIFWVIVGLLMIAAAQILDGEGFITSLPNFPLEIAPLIMITGLILFISSQIFYKG